MEISKLLFYKKGVVYMRAKKIFFILLFVLIIILSKEIYADNEETIKIAIGESHTFTIDSFSRDLWARFL